MATVEKLNLTETTQDNGLSAPPQRV